MSDITNAIDGFYQKYRARITADPNSQIAPFHLVPITGGDGTYESPSILAEVTRSVRESRQRTRLTGLNIVNNGIMVHRLEITIFYTNTEVGTKIWEQFLGLMSSQVLPNYISFNIDHSSGESVPVGIRMEESRNNISREFSAQLESFIIFEMSIPNYQKVEPVPIIESIPIDIIKE